MSKKIKNNVRALRFENNETTQEQLANKTQVTRQTIAAIENNKYSPSLELAFKISDTFKLPICKVFSYGTNDSFEDVHKIKGGGARKTDR
ncbi:MAG: helix-turn-helix transcriptional regulator [bacterium]|nr:helix-turn-helix transcriptional regulator [bacterium]